MSKDQTEMARTPGGIPPICWRHEGEVRLENGQVRFPDAPKQPGLFRFRFFGKAARDYAHVYVGESDQLDDRMKNFKSPDKTQGTNVRVNDKFHDYWGRDGSIKVDFFTDVSADLNDQEKRCELKRAAQDYEENADKTLIRGNCSGTQIA